MFYLLTFCVQPFIYAKETLDLGDSLNLIFCAFAVGIREAMETVTLGAPTETTTITRYVCALR